MNFAVLLLGIALCWMCFYLAKQFMSTDMALITAVLFAVLIYGSRLDATHHWFSMLAAMIAVHLLLPKRSAARIAAAGAMLGIASFFTQTAGAAGAIAIMATLAWEHDSEYMPWRTIFTRQALLLLAFALSWGILSAHFIASVGWKQFWYYQITYPRQYVVYSHEFLFPDFRGLFTLRALPDLAQRLSVYLLLLVIYPAVLWHCRRKRRDNMHLILLAWMGLLLLLEIITRVNWNRIYIASMPAFILLFWALGRNERSRRYATTIVPVIVIAIAVMQIGMRYRHAHRVLALPAGKAVLSQQDYEEFFWLIQHTKPGDYFFETSWLNLYPPLELRSPVYIDGLWPNDVTRPEYVALTVEQLEQKQVKYIFLAPRWIAPDNPNRPWTDHLGPFLDYLTHHYRRIHVFSNQDGIWERRQP